MFSPVFVFVYLSFNSKYWEPSVDVLKVTSPDLKKYNRYADFFSLKFQHIFKGLIRGLTAFVTICIVLHK